MIQIEEETRNNAIEYLNGILFSLMKLIIDYREVKVFQKNI